jgi:hypothetical protein
MTTFSFLTLPEPAAGSLFTFFNLAFSLSNLTMRSRISSSESGESEMAARFLPAEDEEVDVAGTGG